MEIIGVGLKLHITEKRRRKEEKDDSKRMEIYPIFILEIEYSSVD
jgi:hypothetical protein